MTNELIALACLFSLSLIGMYIFICAYLIESKKRKTAEKYIYIVSDNSMKDYEEFKKYW